MCLPGMTEAIAAKILDWVDPDDAMRPGGAEREQYSDLHVPYAPRNGCPARLEELLLIPDMSRDLLFGRDLNLDYQLSAHETGDRAERMGSQTGGIAIPWASLLTLYSAERNVNARGLPRIFLNEPNLRKLHGQLTRVMEPAAAEFIIWYRQLGPVSTEKSGPRQPPPPPMMTGPSPGPSMGVPAGMTVPSVPTASAGGRGGQPPTIGVGGPMQGAAGSPLSAGAGSPPGASPSQAGAGQTPQGMDAPLDLDRPARFTIDSVLDLIGARVMASPPGSREPKFLESPFAAERTAMQSYLPALLDETSVTADVVLRGRVNINTAPRAVLRAAPGMDERLVETICSNRTVDTENTGRQHPIWLLTEGLVDLQTMRALLPNMTCGGGVFRAQVVGYFEEGGPVARAEVVVDATVRPPRPVLWTDLRIRGHGIARGEL
jgi:hypothetical protein